MTWAAVALGAVAFVLMEPVTALLHRALFHGPGWALHRSHHRAARAGGASAGGASAEGPGAGGLEANDLFPVGIAAVTILVIALGTVADGLAALVPIGAGVTAYGAAYAAVHDFYIHRRVDVFPHHLPVLERLRDAHGLHHRFNEAPYGMLCPVVPARIRARARAADTPPAEVAAAASLRHSGTRARVENTS